MAEDTLTKPQPTQPQPSQTPTKPDTNPGTKPGAKTAAWHAVLAVEGVRTSDRREFTPNSLRWRSLPLPLMMQLQTAERHQGSVVVGRIERIERRDNEIHGWGTFDLGSDNGREAHRLVDEQILRGISIDAELLEIDKEMLIGEDGEAALVVEEARIGAATIVSFPAFPQAVIALDGTDIPPATEDGRGESRDSAFARNRKQDIAICLSECDKDDNCVRECMRKKGYSISDDETFWAWKPSIVAHAEQQGPPAAWFTDPELKALTPLTVARNGRIYGHAADWNSCHTGYRECMRPPRSRTNYAHFLTGAVLPTDCDCDDALATGPITLGTTHANPYAPPEAARRHYDNTGMAVADVTVGEDAFGIWVAGALRPGVTDAQIRALRASSLSGDWRYIGGNMELISLLAVNTPGFPIPRVAAGIEAGVQISLVAAGIPEDTNAPDDAPTGADPAELIEELKRERESKTDDDTDSNTDPDTEPSADPATTDEDAPADESTNTDTDPATTDDGDAEPPAETPPSSGLTTAELIKQMRAAVTPSA